ncbi:MAG TPA: isoprenylcysteine carboxylmethyltransferase family protein [Pyrinomonadaceae bacterium]|nr:isoprenylcysteine carboxylmethyltransferase family protein [Pyrinomonadaceae bacterium]
MQHLSHYFSIAAFAVLIPAWIVFLGLFVLGRKPAAAPDSKRAPQSFAGLALQAVAVGIVWMFYRVPFLSPLVEGQFLLNIALALLAVILVVGAIIFAHSAVKELGKQFALQARLIEGHELITTGVYGIVRHPIYTAFFAMMLATGLVLSHWLALIAATCLFLFGTRIRTASEDRLLSDAFGEVFLKWKEKVPALIPFVRY